MSTPSFQDVVSVTGGTLAYKGGAFQMGTTTVSTNQIDLVNSGGTLALQAAPTGNGTVMFPTSGGTLLTNVDISAGTTSSKVSAWTYSNANNVSFGFDGSNITATATVATSLTNINISAGTTSRNLSNVVFSNSNGVSFGLSGSTVTGSVATSLTNINVSAGTTSNNLSAVVFSNSNGVSFGLNGSTVTGSVATSLTNINISAGTTSSNVSAVTFSNANNVSFGFDGTNITGSIATSQAAAGNLSSFQPYPPVGINTAFAVQAASLSLQPIVVPYNLTVTGLMFLSSNTVAGTNLSTISATYRAALFTLATAAGGVSAWTLSSASSQSVTTVLPSAAGSAAFYQSMTVASWAMTPGIYVFGLALSGLTNASMSMAAGSTAGTISVKNGAELQSFVLTGVYNSGGIPSSIAVSDTASYVRSGSRLTPPWALFMGS